MPTPLDRPHTIPPEVALRGRYILLAIVAHVLLFVALGMNMQWRSEAPPPTMAELWVELPNTPLADPEPQQPTPTPEPIPTPPPVQEDPRIAEAQIALEQTRRQAAEAEKLRLAQEETLRKQAAEKERQEAKEREEAAKREHLAAEEKARELKAEEERKAEEQKQREETAKRERLEAEEKARQLKAEEERKAEEQKQREAAERRRIQAEKEAAAERERIRNDQLARMEGALGGSGNSNTGPVGPTGGTGTSSHLAYTNRLAGIVKRNITYTGDTAGNPEARVYVETDQNGRITVVKLTRSSGNPLWDDTVVKAIWKTGQFPADTNGKRPDTKFDFRLKPLD